MNMNKMLRVAWPSVVLATFAAASPRYCKPHGSLQVALGEMHVDYCDADADLALATIHVKVTFTNLGKRYLILSRKLGPDENLKVTDLSGEEVFSPNITNYETDIPDLGSTSSEKMFEMVKPGASVERDFVTGFYISKDPSHRVDSTPVPGSNRLWVSHSTWPVYGDEARAKQMRDQWIRHGLLVLRPIKLEGIHVDISLPQRMPPCQGQHSDSWK
jgi:hypothetical protein